MFIKKSTLVIYMIVAVLLIASTAHAGIMSAVLKPTAEWILEHAIGTIMTMVFMVIGAFFGGSKWGKVALRARAPINELDDVAVKLYQARKANSPGGKNITNEEWEAILAEAQDVVVKTIEAFGTTPPAGVK